MDCNNQYFHQIHSTVSPKKKDIGKCSNPDYPCQTQIAYHIYRMESLDELWESFQNFVPHIANKIMNKKHPRDAKQFWECTCYGKFWRETIQSACVKIVRELNHYDMDKT